MSHLQDVATVKLAVKQCH